MCKLIWFSSAHFDTLSSFGMRYSTYDKMKCIFTALLISACLAGLHGSEIIPKAGIVFRHVGEVVLSGDSWNLVGELKVATLQEELNKIVSVLNTISNMTSTLDGGKDAQDSFQGEAIALKERLAQVQNKVDVFDQILRDKPPSAPQRNARKKRFIGLSFGISNLLRVGRLDGRIKHLEGKVDDLAAEITSFKAETTTGLNNLDTRVEENKKRINDLQARLKKFSNFVGKSLVLSSMLRSLGLILESIDSYVIDMMEAIHDLLQNRLSPKLVSPLDLVVALKTANRKLPESIRPLTEVEQDAVYDYYTYASIQGYATKSSIVFYIKLPLKAEKRHFDLYRPHSLPVYDERSGHFLEVTAPGHLVLVSKLKEKAAELTSDLEECKHLRKMYVCPASFPLETLEISCTLSLVLGAVRNVIRLCDRKIVPPGFTPIWVRDQYGWYYSVSQTTRITKIAEDAKTPIIYTIEGTGYIADSPGFYLRINDDEEELFPSDHLGENASVHINETGEVVIPPFSLIEAVAFAEGEVLHQQRNLVESSSIRLLPPTSAPQVPNEKVETGSPVILIVAVVLLYVIVFSGFAYLMCRGRQSNMNPLETGPARLALMAVATDGKA